MKTSIFNDFRTPAEEQDIYAVFETIKSTKYESEIKSIRLAHHQEDKLLGDELKKQLPAFTPSGTFSYRNAESILVYNQIVHLDFDHLEYEELNAISKKINACSYTLASFISPSGKGIKIFVKVGTSKEEHLTSWNFLREFYFDLLGIEADVKCKDISRLCFFSNDDKLYLNTESETFNFSKLTNNSLIDIPEMKTKNIEYCLNFTNKKEKYVDGNRNNYIYCFACNANRFGISENETYEYLISNFDLNQSEIKASVRSAYKNSTDFAKFAIVANVAENHTLQKENQFEDILLKTPIIPVSVYDNLPQLLKQGADAFEQQREKDVFLTSALSIISGCLPNVSGEYSQRIVYPNLFTFILAPAASGKGSMSSAKELADKYHSEILKKSLDEKEDYERELREYKKQNSNSKKSAIEQVIEPPIEPKFQVVFIPANSSSAKIYQHLKENDEQGIICETEADTLGQVFKNEWGSYSDLLRKGFHHEKISMSRKTNNEYLEINQPRLSVTLSGTPNQIFNIITNAEDGLFSRFIFYLFRSETIWLSPAPKKGRENLTVLFKSISNKVNEMVGFLKTYSSEICLTESQWEKLDLAFTNHLQDIESLVGGDALSVVKRMGLILFRFCMIFTAIRKFENGDTSTKLFCSDDDFTSAMQLIEVYLQHSILMFNNLPNQSDKHSIKNKPKKERFFDTLPQKFHRKEAVEIGLELGIKERTIDNTLKNWVGNLLSKEDTGVYFKS